jgi:Asparagine synthase/Glutamine amidotransferase domain
MNHFLLTTVRDDPRLHEVVPHFLYSQRLPAVPRNARHLRVFLDGHLANLTQLRRDLPAADFSPEEVLAALYVQNRGFAEITGYFSAVIVDTARRALLGFTDRNCVGELYYRIERDNQIKIASRFEPLLPHSDKRLNAYAVSCFFCLGDIEREDTLVDDIKRITQFYTLRLDGHLTITNEYLAKLSAIPVCRTAPRREILDRLERLLIDGIKNFTSGPEPVCNTLSGGVDSSYLQALLIREHHRTSFSIAFAKHGQDNAYAADVAECLGAVHEASVFTADEFLCSVERGIRLTGKPHMYQGEAMFLKLYERIAARLPNARVVSGQTADGALDSALPRPLDMAVRFRRLPNRVVDWALAFVTDEWRGLGAEFKAPQISSVGLRCIEQRSDIWRRVSRYLGVSRDVFTSIADVANQFSGDKGDQLAKAHLYSGEMRRIPNMLSTLAESVGLRIVFPFLEPTFLEYSLTIPARLKHRKYLGRKLAERHIPRHFVYRPKIGKGIPFGALFTEEEAWIEILDVIRKAHYYDFDVDEMIADQEYSLLLRLINFHLWKRDVLDAR